MKTDTKRLDHTGLGQYAFTLRMALEGTLVRHNLAFLRHSHDYVVRVLEALGEEKTGKAAQVANEFERLRAILVRDIQIAELLLLGKLGSLDQAACNSLGASLANQLKRCGILHLGQMREICEWELRGYGFTGHEIHKIKMMLLEAGIRLREDSEVVVVVG